MAALTREVTRRLSALCLVRFLMASGGGRGKEVKGTCGAEVEDCSMASEDVASASFGEQYELLVGWEHVH